MLFDIRGAENSIRREDLELLLCQTPACSATHKAKRQKVVELYENSVRSYEPMISYPGEHDLYQKFTSSFAQYLEASKRAGDLLSASKTGDALDVLSSDAIVGDFDTALAAASDDLSLNAKNGTEEARSATSASTRATWINAVVTLFIVLLAAIIGIVLRSRVTIS